MYDHITLESIAMQDGKCFNELSDEIKRFRRAGDYSTEAVSKAQFSNIIKEHINLNTEISVVKGERGAYVLIPKGTTRDGLSQHNVSSYEVMTTWVDVAGGKLRGGLDPKRARVSGFFSNLLFTIVLGEKLLLDNYTDEEIAAILLHEVGHAYYFCHFTGHYFRGAAAIETGLKRIYSDTPHEKRTIELRRLRDVCGIDKSFGVDKMTDIDKDGAEVVFLTALVTNPSKSINNSELYDFRNFEQLADIFAVKMGAGAHLATGLDKIQRKFGSYGIQSRTLNTIVQLISLIALLLTATTISGLIMMLFRQDIKIYDDPKDRIIFAKQQLIEELKNLPRTDTALRKKLLEQIDEYDKVINNITMYFSLFRWANENLSIFNRILKKQEHTNKTLEELMNNDLFVHSARLQTR